MTGTDDEQQRGRRQRRHGEPDLGVLTPPSIPRIELPAIPAPRGGRQAGGQDQAGPAPTRPRPALPAGLTAPSALLLRNRAARTSRRLMLLAAVCLIAATSPHLPAAGRWPLAAVVLLGAARAAQVWARAFRRRRAERALGSTTWPGAEELARL